MGIYSVINLIGGLALFLFGMNLMSTSLEKLAGGKLEKTLEKVSSNLLKAVLLGLGVTAVIQSSSATTVMVVGFVNSGIMKLTQAIGIIMGANIGTTVTAWLLSATGLEGDNIFISLLKPSNFAPILAAVGVVMIVFCKRGKKRDIGSMLAGFAILMIGMQNMSSAVKPLANVPEFTNILVMFKNPVLGVLMGLLLTAVLQSSSASVGILQALAATGSVTYSAAIPIIMGQNIGTCVTALISCIGAKKNAKRAAMVHFYFNIIGSVLFLGVFYLLNVFLKFSFLDKAANIADIAVIHTLFNVITTAVMLPFAKGLEKLAIITVRGADTEKSITVPDRRFLDMPSFAIEQTRKSVDAMADTAKNAVLSAVKLLDKYDGKNATIVAEQEELTDMYENKVGSFVVDLSAQELNSQDSRTAAKMLHIIGDWERIGDHALNISETALEIHSKKIVFSQETAHELDVIRRAVCEVIDLTALAQMRRDENIAKSVEPLEQTIDFLREQIKERETSRLLKGESTTELGFVMGDLLTNYERISDHCSNIALAIMQIHAPEIASHGYFDAHDSAFEEEFTAYKTKYAL